MKNLYYNFILDGNKIKTKNKIQIKQKNTKPEMKKTNIKTKGNIKDTKQVIYKNKHFVKL